MNKTYTVYLLVAKECANGTLKTTNHFKWQFI